MRIRESAFALSVLLVITGSVTAQSVTFRTIAVSGQQVNELEDVTFGFRTGEPGFLIPWRSIAMNNAGWAAFESELSDGSTGIFVDANSGVIQELARTGQRPDFSPDNAIFHFFDTVNVNDNNSVMYSGAFGTARTSGDFQGGVWKFDEENGTQLVARSGALTQDAEPHRVLPYDRVHGSFLNGNDQVVFNIYHQGQTIEALADDGQDQFRTIAAEGTAEQFISPQVRGYNDRGEAFLFANHPGNSPMGGGSDFDPNRGVWSEAGGTLHPIARTTQPSIPGSDKLLLNGDGDFDAQDLIVAFQSGGYEQGIRPARHAVPEPSSFVFCAAAALWLFAKRARGLSRFISFPS